MLLQTIFTTGRDAELFVREGMLLSRVIATRQAAAKRYELALFVGRQSAYDVHVADYGWQEADFTTGAGLLLCDSQSAFATHVEIIMPMGYSCHAEFTGTELCTWIGVVLSWAAFLATMLLFRVASPRRIPPGYQARGDG